MGFVAFLLLVPAARATAQSALTLASALDQAARANPTLAAQSARVEAARLRADGAGSWMPPTVGVSAMNVPVTTLNPTRAAMGIRLMAGQTIPWPGKRAAAERAARFSAESEAAGRIASGRMLAAEVVVAYARLARVEAHHRLLDEKIRLARDLADAATVRYRAGGGTGQGDVRRAQLAVTRLRTDEIALTAEHERASVELATLLGRRPDPSMPGMAHDSLVAATELTDLVQRLDARLDSAAGIATRVELVQLARRQDAVAARLDLARVNRRPDLMLRGEYALVRDLRPGPLSMGGIDTWTAGISITLPTAPWSRRSLSADEAGWAAEARALEADQQALSDRIAAETALRDADRRGARQTLARYDADLLPQARAAYEADLAAYRAGSGLLDGLLDDLRMLTELDLARLMLLNRLAEATARSGQAIGIDWTTAFTH